LFGNGHAFQVPNGRGSTGGGGFGGGRRHAWRHITVGKKLFLLTMLGRRRGRVPGSKGGLCSAVVVTGTGGVLHGLQTMVAGLVAKGYRHFHEVADGQTTCFVGVLTTRVVQGLVGVVGGGGALFCRWGRWGWWGSEGGR